MLVIIQAFNRPVACRSWVRVEAEVASKEGSIVPLSR